MSTRLSWLVALILLACSPRAEAQNVAGSFEQLQSLVKVGDTVIVRDSSGTETSGRIEDVSLSVLTLLTSKGRREWRQSDVTTIFQRRGDTLRNGALWGLATGGGAALILAQVACSNDASCAEDYRYPLAGAVAAGAATVIGAAVDATIRGRHVIYEKPARGVVIGLTPLVGPRRGVMLSVKF
jgi:hypothetical protein